MNFRHKNEVLCLSHQKVVSSNLSNVENNCDCIFELTFLNEKVVISMSIFDSGAGISDEIDTGEGTRQI